MNLGKVPAIWLPAIRAGTGVDVFTQRLCDELNAIGIRTGITWLPRRAEYLPWSVSVPQVPAWANVVHVNSWLPRRFWPVGLPVVVTVHHLVHDPMYRPFRSRAQAAYHLLLIRRRELAAIRSAAAVTAVSDYVRSTVKAFSGRADVITIHNWVDNDRFSPGRARSLVEGRTFQLFMAGSHSRRKGFDLLPAFVEALGSGFEIRYAGGKAGTRTPIAGVTELGRISEHQLVDEYRACDAVVSLSRYEGFGYTAAEAMACGKPFIGFQTSALVEVADDECGLLVQVGDVAALAAAVRRLQDRPSLAFAAGEAGRRRALERFSPINVRAYVDLCQALVNHRESGAVRSK